jgi:N-acetyl-alpha-D-glucosaminyl L-malate synthase BshA
MYLCGMTMEQPLRIGMVGYPTYGGSGVVATELGIALANRGHQVHFITYSQPVRLTGVNKNIRFHEVNVSEYPLFVYPPYELVLASKMVDVVKYEHLDVLHVHYAIPHASAAYMAKKILMDEGIHIPVVTTLHGTDITLLGKDDSFKPVITFAINHSDAITAVSESLKQDTYRFFDIKKPIHVIPNFIQTAAECEKWREIVRREFVTGDEKLCVHTSNFRPVKRVIDVLEVFKRIQEKTAARLVMVGDGPDRHRAEQWCRDHDLSDKVFFVGSVKEPQEILAGADLFILPSESESFGLSALEAMALGVPVISSDTGGLPEVNLQGISGFLCPVGAVEEMANKALDIFHEQKRFSEGARATAAKFDVQKVTEQYLSVYHQALTQS